MYKHCSKCQTSKSIEEFHRNSKHKDGLQRWCKICNISARVDYYKRNSEKEKAYDKDRRIHLQKKLLDFLVKHPCIDCGESNPIVLEFDHTGEKIMEVTVMVHRGWSWQKIEEEISKCEVRCANCHRLKTAERMGTYKGIQLGD